MPARIAKGIAAMLGLMTTLLTLAAQPPSRTPGEELLYLLVFGLGSREIRPTDYPPALRPELTAHLRRFNAYRSTRTGLAKTGEFGMVYSAWTGYERQLAAVSASSKTPALALAYVSELKPCYEWEGYHDCPEREAVFAIKYQAAHPNSPFSAYLPLLAAHRWICAAEGYDYEKQPAEAVRCRRSYEEAAAVARKSDSLLVRTAAEQLTAIGRCFPRE
jgi:hypothetical protein